MPKFWWMTLATGARQFVVQEAFEMTWCAAGSYADSLTPSTMVRSSPLAGALMMTFLTVPRRCLAASSRLVKRPVDSMTTSAPTSSHGICAGSFSEKTRNSSVPTRMPFSVAAMSSSRLPRTESYFKRCASVLVSVMSLTATKSMSLSPRQVRRTLRPMRPKPLIPTLIAIVTEASSPALKFDAHNRRGSRRVARVNTVSFQGRAIKNERLSPHAPTVKRTLRRPPYVSHARVTAVTSGPRGVHAGCVKCMFLKPRAGAGRSRHRSGRGVEGLVQRASRPAVCKPISTFALRNFILARKVSAHPLRDSFKVEKMVKQSRSINAGKRAVALIPSTFLCALLVFGNVVSAFGNTPTGRKARAKSAPASTKEAPPPSDSNAESAQPKSKSVFTKIGEPFVVETAQQSSTQTPAQRDATRPPGTEQQQTVPPGARTNPQDPRTPPGTTRPAPQNPPGIETAPVTQPPATTRPNPAQTDPATQSGTTPTTPADPNAVEQDPTFPVVQPRPVPPMPSLVRVGVIGTDALSLTLNEAIRRALENNNDIEIARADVRLAEQTLNALSGVFDPVFTYTPEYNSSVRPVTNVFGGAGVGGTISTTDFNNDASVTKQFGKGGGNFTYFFNNTRETSSANNQTLNPFYSSAQGLQFTQPLWRNRSIDRNRQQIRIQRKRLEQTDADFRLRTIDVISQVQRAYWDLVFALRNEQNQVANVKLAQENFRRTEASVAAGASAPLQRAEIETELSTRQSALLLANQQVTFAENTLKNLLIKDALSPDWSKALLPTDSPSFEETPLNLETALKEARDNRPEMRRLRLEEDVNDINLQFYKNQTKPRIDLVGTLSTNGLAGTPRGITTIPDPNDPTQRIDVPLSGCTGQEVTGQSCIPANLVGGYGQTLKNVFSLDTRQVIVSAVISLPWKNRTAQANLAYAKIQREQLAATTRSQEQTIEVEVRNAVQAVDTARRRVLFAREALRSAEEQLAGERRLYQVGRSTTFLLFQRENALVNAQNQELQAQTDYNKALADLQRATSTTLRSNNVLIDAPVSPEKFGK